MNERIGKLAEQAGLLGPSSRIGNSHDAAERFAQLIVEECASIVDTYGRWILYDKLAVKIKQHFGVTYD